MVCPTTGEHLHDQFPAASAERILKVLIPRIMKSQVKLQRTFETNVLSHHYALFVPRKLKSTPSQSHVVGHRGSAKSCEPAEASGGL